MDNLENVTSQCQSTAHGIWSLVECIDGLDDSFHHRAYMKISYMLHGAKIYAIINDPQSDNDIYLEWLATIALMMAEIHK